MLFLTCGCLNRVISSLFSFCSSRARHGIAKGRTCGATRLLTGYTRTKRNCHWYTRSLGDKGEKEGKQTDKQRRAGNSSLDWIPGSWVAGVQLKPSLFWHHLLLSLLDLSFIGCLRPQPYPFAPQSLGHYFAVKLGRGKNSRFMATWIVLAIARQGRVPCR
ncbi:hypothetical protein HDV57DRAFT_464174 [Trichoderma longibrachiatum]|uniref:Uncharacterized protein n=1 Tax=Trichoderma longibrachiatum ATCC 18648 TaxID=983965 RepID=A0A2T4C5G4_TRILO|nr:hypothetical protein M440DRAFT_303407 [Trichoderma longibrachiatum ATCC 18648]